MYAYACERKRIKNKSFIIRGWMKEYAVHRKQRRDENIKWFLRGLLIAALTTSVAFLPGFFRFFISLCSWFSSDFECRQVSHLGISRTQWTTKKRSACGPAYVFYTIPPPSFFFLLIFLFFLLALLVTINRFLTLSFSMMIWE